MEHELDLKDKKILSELDTDSRQSFSSIGKKVRLSKEVINYRVRQLVKKGIIKSFYPVIDISKLGYISFRVFLKFQNLTSNKEKELIDYLKNQDSVGWIVSVKGKWDINFVCWNKNNQDFQDLWQNFMAKFKSNLSEYKVSIITTLYQYPRAYIINKKQSENYIIGKGEKCIIDKTDYQILKILSKNSRENSLDISQKIKKSEKVVRDRIKKLVKNKVILDFSVALDLNKIKYSYYKLHLNLNRFKQEDIKKLLDYARQNPFVVYCTETIGGYDFELDIHSKNSQEFFQMIKDIKDKFPGLVKDFEFLQYDQEYKMSYLPVMEF